MGEAPEWVRDAWIGLRLPLADCQKRNWIGFGVISGPRTLIPQLWARLVGRTIRVTGYLVDAETAVELLTQENPAAASWWRQNVPHLLEPGGGFVFDEEACEPQPQ
jgi:hypothetical protein